MFYLCTMITGLPERVKLIQLQSENLSKFENLNITADDIQWVEDDKGNVIIGNSKM